MTKEMEAIRHKARELARGCRLPFYSVFSREIDLCAENFHNNPMLIRLREDILPFIRGGYGHGIEHCKTVSIEAGALALIEAGNFPLRVRKRLALLAQCAGLLHDICRLEEEHARKGALLSQDILADYPLDTRETEIIGFAIRNHEAFTPPQTPPDEETAIVSNCLYDADKFRWGPDNFNTTLWEICDFNDWRLCSLIRVFPAGLEKINEVKNTFRTNTGRMHGPDFIDCGLRVGREIYRLMLRAQSAN
ncbi:MAG: HD domain-containing protein [Desulfonatronovibrionaceae bacterium]